MPTRLSTQEKLERLIEAQALIKYDSAFLVYDSRYDPELKLAVINDLRYDLARIEQKLQQQVHRKQMDNKEDGE